MFDTELNAIKDSYGVDDNDLCIERERPPSYITGLWNLVNNTCVKHSIEKNKLLKKIKIKLF